MRQRVVFARILLGSTLALSLVACRQTSGSTETYASQAEVKRGSVSIVVQMAGQVVAVNSLELDFSGTSGRLVDIMVRTGQEVQAGQELMHLDTTSLQRSLREAEADLKAAEAALTTAQEGAGESELSKAEAELSHASYELDAARLELEVAEKAGAEPLREKVADAAYALQVARDELRLKEIGEGQATIRQLEYDRAFFQRVLRDLPANDAQRAEVQKNLADTEKALARARTLREAALEVEREVVEAKQRELDRAREDLDHVLAGTDDPADASRLAYRAAEEAVGTAQARVDALRAGGESGAVEAARTAYEAAQAARGSAQAGLEAATLRAPFDGTAVAIYVAANDTVGPGQKVMFLADFRELRLEAQVTEVDVPKIELGQQVRVSFDMYPGQLFTGRVLDLPRQAINQSGIAYYRVITTLEHGQSTIRLGMYGNARVVIGQRDNVLTIPSAAIRYNPMGETYVDLRKGENSIEERAVEIGMNDGIQVEVVAGLAEGDTVMVPLVAATDPYGRYGIKY